MCVKKMKRFVRKWLVDIATDIVGSSVCRLVILLWLVTLICTVTYYELAVHPWVSNRHYVPLTVNEETQFWPQPLDKKLVDLKDFVFLTYQHCDGKSPFLIVLVSSAPAHRYHRYVIRTTWGKSFRVLFLLGESKEFSSDLDSESAQYGDLIRGSFIDSYKNMTYKHVMGLKWISTNCAGAKYVLKVDDDVFVNVHSLMDWLVQASPLGSNKMIACQMETNRGVHRYSESKWYVSKEEYSRKHYPEYCRGWAVIYSQDVVRALYLGSLKVPYFWIDDIYVTGLLAKRAGVRITRLQNLTLTHDRVSILTILNYEYDKPFIFYLTSPKRFQALQYSVNEDI